MLPPVRMVCGDCLRSVDLAPDEGGRLPTLCPVCGGTIDSRLSDLETPTSHFATPLPGDPLTPGENRWTETWAKGNFGTIGRFQIREMLGDGGFGQVYQAYDPRLDRDVALKVLKQADPGDRVMQRFFREARAAARLSHPNIVGVHDAGSDGGRFWVAYEYVDGRTLSRYLDAQKVDIPAAVRITRDLADALDHAHRQGVYHRDLKPANVIIDNEGRPHVIDFGLARRADLDSDLTRDGAILGTPAYMSPEQASGRSHLADERSDVYSLGVILFELITGRRPGDAPTAALAWQVKPVSPPPSARSVNRDVPVALERIVNKALAADPQHRYPDAGAFAAELDRWLKARQGPVGLSYPLAAVLMGVAGSLLLMAALQSAFEPPARTPAPSVRAAAPAAKGATPPAPVKARAGVLADNTAPPTQVYQGPVFHTHSSTKFHPPGCRHLSRSVNVEQVASVEAARQRGWEPCEVFRALFAVIGQAERDPKPPG